MESETIQRAQFKIPKKISAAILITILLFGTLATWGMMATIIDTQGQIVFQQNTLIDLQKDLIDLQEKILANINTVFIEPTSGQSIPLNVEVHLEMWHWRDGELLTYSRHAGVLTTTGKNWIEGVLGDADGDQGDYIGLSNSTDAPSSAWTELPDEITTGAMSRAIGTYADDGDGQWNITKSFSPTESNSTRLVGLYSTAATASLIASDTIAAINYENGDTVQLRWTITVA
jgi:hypothetical protein